MTREMASHIITSKLFHFLSASSSGSLIIDALSRCSWNEFASLLSLRRFCPAIPFSRRQGRGSSLLYSAIPFDLRTVEWVFVALLRYPFWLADTTKWAFVALLRYPFWVPLPLKCSERSPMNYIPFDECPIHFQAVQSKSVWLLLHMTQHFGWFGVVTLEFPSDP